MTEATIEVLHHADTLENLSGIREPTAYSEFRFHAPPRPHEPTRNCPVVFIVDRQATTDCPLALAAERRGWRVETYAGASEFESRSIDVAPGCLILDVTIPNEENLALQKHVAAGRKDLPIILVADEPDIRTTVEAMRLGAHDFFLKPAAEHNVLNSVERALEISARIRHEELQRRAYLERHNALSRRERDVMALVISGLLNKQIAGELGISEITVKAHRGKMMRKMQAGSVANLVRIAGKIGLAPVAGMSRHRFPLAQIA